MRLHATAFAPASIGNLGVGFDILGQSFAGPGDRATVRRTDEPGVRIIAIRGSEVGLPWDAALNTAGAALIALRTALELPFGFEIELDKGIPFGSGMGGSAASCVAALVAANALLDCPLKTQALYEFALAGETVASGGRHGDNVGPMLIGGVVLTTTDRLVRIAVPAAWHSVVVHPQAVLETRCAREVLKCTFAIGEFVAQSANLALFLMGCLQGDPALVREGMRDVLVEPRRAALIVGFSQIKQAALESGALGASISGAGPSVFAWFESQASAESAAPAMRAAFAAAGVASESFVSPVNGPPASLLA